MSLPAFRQPNRLFVAGDLASLRQVMHVFRRLRVQFHHERGRRSPLLLSFFQTACLLLFVLRNDAQTTPHRMWPYRADEQRAGLENPVLSGQTDYLFREGQGRTVSCVVC